MVTAAPESALLSKEETLAFQTEILSALTQKQKCLEYGAGGGRTWEFSQLDILRQARIAKNFFEEIEDQTLYLSRHPDYALLRKDKEYNPATRNEDPTILCLRWKEWEGTVEAISEEIEHDLPIDLPLLQKKLFINSLGKIKCKV
jgi:hypothetical protein